MARRIRMSDLQRSRAAWSAFEHSAEEAAYRRWMAEQEAGDDERDAREARQEVSDGDER